MDARTNRTSDAYRRRLKLNVGLKRTRSSDTDRSRRERTAGLEWLYVVLGHRWKRLIHIVGIDLRVIGDRRQYVKKQRGRRETALKGRFLLGALALASAFPRGHIVINAPINSIVPYKLLQPNTEMQSEPR